MHSVRSEGNIGNTLLSGIQTYPIKRCTCTLHLLTQIQRWTRHTLSKIPVMDNNARGKDICCCFRYLHISSLSWQKLFLTLLIWHSFEECSWWDSHAQWMMSPLCTVTLIKCLRLFCYLGVLNNSIEFTDDLQMSFFGWQMAFSYYLHIDVS